ncbi:MAG: hypothetical protein ABIP39_01140 [Polyangiaceae bacterium]
MTKRPWLVVFSFVVAALPVAFGCNAVLGNERADLFVDEAGTSVLDASPDTATDTNVEPMVDAAPLPDAAMAEAGACGPGKKSCFGQCVSNTDPLYGCNAAECAPCTLTRASATCAGGACAVGACDPGYSNCNNLSADGCETDLAQTGHCGTCNTVCDGTPTPYCAPSGSGFACSTNCTALAPTLCGTQCADLNTSRAHCGDCNTACPVVANGTETCVARACQLACATNFHACSGACASNADPNTCGSSCTPCVPPANSTATCGAGACGFACKAGHGNCDANAVNGCETTFASDPLNCGTCGHSCLGQACTAGVCDAPPPPDAGGDATPD